MHLALLSMLIIVFLFKHFKSVPIQNITHFLENYSVVSTNLRSSGERNHISSGNCMHFSLVLNDSEHTFCVHTRLIIGGDDDVTDKNTTIYIHGSSSVDEKIYKLKDFALTKAHGHDVAYPSSSLLEGFVENNCFYGHMYVHDTCYYLEPIAKFPHILRKINSTMKSGVCSLAVLYENSGFRNYMRNFEEKVRVDVKGLASSYNTRKKRDHSVKIEGRLCSALLHADNVYFRDIGQGNIKSAVSQMLYALDQANVIFRNADFDEDGQPDNIGFQVKHIVIMTADGAANFPEKGAIEGRHYLRHLSTYFLLDQVCIGIGFTGRPFKSRILGLSYTAAVMQPVGPVMGGICERGIGGLQMNVLALSVTSEAGYRIPTAVVVLSLAHELGHSFGSPHDDQCHGYLMSETNVDGSLRSHYMFSPCSRRKIAQVIRTKGFCLYESNQSFCGNGLLEHDEDCDCGLAIDCLQRDVCCTPRGAPGGGCRVKSGAGHTCRPSQGLCCTSNCQLRDLHHLGLNCSLQNNVCPCPERGPSDCVCGLLGSCIAGSCHCVECTRLGLEECQCTEGSGHCMSCCRDSRDGSCVSSLTMTARLLHEGVVTPSSLARRDNIPPPHVHNSTFIIRKFCHQDRCVHLGFRVWQPEAFCVAFGKLGICSAITIPQPKLRSRLEMAAQNTRMHYRLEQRHGAFDKSGHYRHLRDLCMRTDFYLCPRCMVRETDYDSFQHHNKFWPLI